MHEVLVDLEFYGEWWPQVRAVAKIDDDHALVVCRSSLPYDLELVLSAVPRDPSTSRSASTDRSGGGRGTSSTKQGPGVTQLRFEQQVRAEAPLFVVASYVARPLLVWNHHRMMREPSRAYEGVASCQPSAASAAS